MNPRIATAAVGGIMVALGLFALFFPEFVMTRVLGFAVGDSHGINTVLGEVRATYGGLITVAGAWTLWSATNPVANRSLILFVALLWLGAGGGRIFGVIVDGDPGIFGWISIVFELVCGGVLLASSQLATEPEPGPAASFGT